MTSLALFLPQAFANLRFIFILQSEGEMSFGQSSPSHETHLLNNRLFSLFLVFVFFRFLFASWSDLHTYTQTPTHTLTHSPSRTLTRKHTHTLTHSSSHCNAHLSLWLKISFLFTLVFFSYYFLQSLWFPVLCFHLFVSTFPQWIQIAFSFNQESSVKGFHSFSLLHESLLVQELSSIFSSKRKLKL